MTKKTGEAGEKLAHKFLKKQGLKILAKNYRALRGEIDIIAREGESLIFIEVKANRAGSNVPPENRVNAAKQRQIGKIARAFIQDTGMNDLDCRFDVISVILFESGKHEITHIRDAFWLPRDV